MTTYAYVRVSSSDQTIGTSLEDQERVIRGCAMMRGGSAITLVSDPDVSGYSIPLAERPAGGEMFRALKRGDVVIVAKMDRIFRNASDALSTAQKFKARGVDLILCDMGTEPVTTNGAAKMFFGMLALVAEFERDRIMERTAEGRKGKKARGGHVGGYAPHGYRVEGSGMTAMLVEYLPEQKIVRMIRGLREAGVGVREIVRRLEADGVANRLGRPFAKTQVLRILDRRDEEMAA